MKKTFLTLTGLWAAGLISAQVYISSESLDTTGVTNEGMAVGCPTGVPNLPFFLWDPFNDTYEEIGGVSAGDGVGGVARFSDDGMIIAAPNHYDNIPVSSIWNIFEYPDFKGWKFNEIVYLSDYNIFAVGSNTETGKGIILKTANNGTTWRQSDYIVELPDGEIVPQGEMLCATVAGVGTVIVGGTNGQIYFGPGNGTWKTLEIAPEGEENNVAVYRAMDFIYTPDETTYSQFGVIGVENKDGSYAVWYTIDEGDTFQVSSNVGGMPMCLTDNDETFWMGCENGIIQKSADYGEEWQDVTKLPTDLAVNRIRFSDNGDIIALAGKYAFCSYDGGIEWKELNILPPSINPCSDTEFSWNDAVWNGEEITVIGNQGKIFKSVDNGKSFSAVAAGQNESADLGAMFFNNDAYNILGNEGQFFRKSEVADVEAFAAGIYSVEDGSWTPLATSGFDQQQVASSPWNISGDGNHVVGGIYDNNPSINLVGYWAAIWNGTGEYIKLDNMYDAYNRFTRANAVNYDGSVVAGWQDMFGPWFGSVWRKGADGTYSQELMYADDSFKDLGIDYIKNQDKAMSQLLGYCQCVSNDGKWIGGNGAANTGIHGPWLWNEEKGLIVIDGDLSGCTSVVANDGSMALGWNGSGQGAWIWTEENGKMELNDYARNILNADYDENFYIASVYDMSPNGRYVTGYGMYGQTPLAYVLDLKPVNVGIDKICEEQVKAAVYPNPVSDFLHVDVPYSGESVETTITLCDMQGHTIFSRNAEDAGNVISVSHIPAGIYILNVTAGNQHKAFKVVIRH